MGQTATETLRELKAARAQLADDLDLLGARLPQAGEIKAEAGIAAGGVAAAGLVVATVGAAVRRRVVKRRQRKARRREARATAEELARVLVDASGSVNATVEQRTISSRTGPIALVAALIALVVAAIQFVNGRGHDAGF